MIVVDTNIISYFYLNSAYSSFAEEIFKKEPIWSAPLLWRSEFRNVLSMYMKRKILSLSEALEIFELAETLLQENEYEINSFQVLRLAETSGCSAYDCEFISLSNDLRITLVTEDKKILNSFPESTKSMAQFLGK